MYKNILKTQKQMKSSSTKNKILWTNQLMQDLLQSFNIWLMKHSFLLVHACLLDETFLNHIIGHVYYTFINFSGSNS